MSAQQKKLNCACCKAYLFEDDDVVHCPVCGAPHHRDCYNKIGHCALEELHGTPDEYDSSKETQSADSDQNFREEIKEENYTTCRMCGEKYDRSLPKCPKCSAPDFSRMGGNFVQFDFLGGVPANMDLGDGVTADEAKKFVMSNTHRYIPKFAGLHKKKRISWNWLAFLLPGPWMFSRKMYKNGFIASALTVISTLLTIPLLKSLYGLGLPEMQSYMEMFRWITEKLPEINTAVLLVAVVGSALSIGVQIVSAMYADYMYKKHTVDTVKSIKADSEDIESDFRKKGGVNFIWFFISAMLIQYIPNIIVIFL